MVTEYPAGWLDDIGFVAIYTRYQGKWVYSWHKHRKSWEHPGGHVESGEFFGRTSRKRNGTD